MNVSSRTWIPYQKPNKKGKLTSKYTDWKKKKAKITESILCFTSLIPVAKEIPDGN